MRPFFKRSFPHARYSDAAGTSFAGVTCEHSTNGPVPIAAVSYRVAAGERERAINGVNGSVTATIQYLCVDSGKASKAAFGDFADDKQWASRGLGRLLLQLVAHELDAAANNWMIELRSNLDTVEWFQLRGFVRAEGGADGDTHDDCVPMRLAAEDYRDTGTERAPPAQQAPTPHPQECGGGSRSSSPASETDDGDEEYAVKSILAVRSRATSVVGSVVEFYVDWQPDGRFVFSPTWEPLECLACGDLVQSFLTDRELEIRQAGSLPARWSRVTVIEANNVDDDNLRLLCRHHCDKNNEGGVERWHLMSDLLLRDIMPPPVRPVEFMPFTRPLVPASARPRPCLCPLRPCPRTSTATARG